jgi:sugar O-acyltransferase (sialic acid O-acetyltransferase NeuD family)
MKEGIKAVPKKLLIVGAGGLGTEYAWVAEEMNHAALRTAGGAAVWEILGFTDDDPGKKGTHLAGYLVHGTVQQAFEKFGKNQVAYVVAIGNNKARRNAAQAAEALGWTAGTLIHPSAIVAGSARVGPGSYLGPGTVVCPNASLGKHVIINTHVSVGHDSVIEDFAQICPGVRVSGGCRVGAHGFVGSNASLAPGVLVGESAVVGANSLAIRKVAPGTTVLGCPALVVERAQK